MDNDEYLTTQFMILHIAAALRQLDLGKFLERISRTHAFAPILDPTLYRMGIDKLSTVETIAATLYSAQQKLKDIDLDQFLNQAVDDSN